MNCCRGVVSGGRKVEAGGLNGLSSSEGTLVDIVCMAEPSPSRGTSARVVGGGYVDATGLS
jgi:hypothetical protein